MLESDKSDGFSSWYYVIDGDSLGPVDEKTLRSKFSSGEIGPHTLVWRDGFSEWKPLSDAVDVSRPPPVPSPLTLSDSKRLTASRPQSALGNARRRRSQTTAGDTDTHLRSSGPSSSLYAGFWKRLLAYIIDYILLLMAAFILLLIFYASNPEFAENSLGESTKYYENIFWFCTFVVYFSTMESSSTQATLGKMALGIKVTDNQGNRISFAHALGRNFGRLLCILTLGVGYIMAGWTKHKQGLHDMVAGCLVVNKSSANRLP